MAIWYIADIAHGGSDSNSGTSASPFLTLVKAWRSCADNDFIYIKTPGTWDGQIAKFHTRALAGTGTSGGADPTGSNSNWNPKNVTIQIDPTTTTGTATFKIPVGTGWSKWRTEGQNNITLKYGTLWHWESTVAGLHLTIKGLDADGVTQRIILQDYADSTHRYDFYGAEGEYSACFSFRSNGGSAENCWVEGVIIHQYGAQGFFQENTHGCHWKRCTTEGGNDNETTYDATNISRTANILANGVGRARGTAIGFRFDSCDGSRSITTLAASAARGDSTVTVTSAAGMAVGDPIVIFGTVNASLDPWGGEQAEVRKITNIAGNVLTLGGYRHAMTTEFLTTYPLRFPHALGVRVATQFGMEDCGAVFNGRSTRNTNVSTPWTTAITNDDVGGEGIAWKGTATNVMIYHSEVGQNWTTEGCYDYNVDGGTMETFNMGEFSRCVFNMNKCHDNHALWETGTNSGTAANGSALMSQNVVYGTMDFQDKGRANMTASAGFALLRAARHWVIRSNTFYFTRGSNNYGFIHDFGSSYSGPANSLDNIKILDNLCVTTYDTQLYRWVSNISGAVGTGVIPPGEKCDYNLFFRTTSAGAIAAFNAFTSPTSFAYSEPGRVSFNAQTGLGAHDLWAVDPVLVNPAGNDFSLSGGSPAKGAGEFGDDIGAIPYVATSVPGTISDQFNRTVPPNGWGTADQGGPYTLTGVTGSSSAQVINGIGQMVLSAQALRQGANLLGVLQRDFDVTFQIAIDKVPTVGQCRIEIGTRFNPSNVILGGYYGQIFFNPSGAITGNFFQRSSTDGTQTALIAATDSGLAAYSANQIMWVRLQVLGASPTTLNMKVWYNGTSEPGSWNWTTTDSTAGNQSTGALGFYGATSTTISNSPITFSFDNIGGGTSVTQVSVTDSGTGTDTLTMAADNQMTDAGVGTDSIVSVSADVQLTETGVGSEVVSPQTPFLAFDSYSRTTTSPSLGNAEIGGAYTNSIAGSASTTLNADGTQAVNFLFVAGNSIRAQLLSLQALNVDHLISFKTDKLAAGGNQFVISLVRCPVDNTSYGAQITITNAAAMQYNFLKYISGTQTALTTAVASGLTHVANQKYWLRFQAEGENPTTLRLKVWQDGTSEPGSWTGTTTDSSSQLQAPGGVGFRTNIGGATTNAPVTINIDDLQTIDIVPQNANQVITEIGIGTDLFDMAADIQLTDSGLGTDVITVEEFTPQPQPVPSTAPTFESALKSHQMPLAKVEFLGPDFQTVLYTAHKRLISGTVTTDRKTDTFATASLSLVNKDGLFSPNDETSLVWPDKLVRVSRGVMVGDTPMFQAQITGIIANPADSAVSGDTSFTVNSRFAIARRNFNGPVTFPVGMRGKDAIRSLAELGGLGTSDFLYNLNDGGYLILVARTFDAGTDILGSMIKWAFDMGCDLWPDGNGVVQMQPFVDPGTVIPKWDFGTDSKTTLITSYTRTIQSSTRYNRQDVYGRGPDGYPLSARAVITDPTDPYFWTPALDLPAPIYTSTDINSVAAASVVAQKILLEVSGYEETLEVQAIPIPLVAAGDVVSFSTAVAPGNYRLNQVQIPVTHGAMRMTTSRIRTVRHE